MKYKLKTPEFISPKLLRNLPGEATIVDNDAVLLASLKAELKIDYKENQQKLNPGQKVRVWINNFFWCESLEDHNKKIQKTKEHQKQKRDQNRRKAEAFNTSLHIPVKWRTGMKDVLSGLSLNSWGDGTKKNTVGHIELLEPLKAGRLHREKGAFLCSKNKGKQWSGQSHHQLYDGSGKLYDAPVSCKACLRLAKTLKIHRRKTQDEKI